MAVLMSYRYNYSMLKLKKKKERKKERKKKYWVELNLVVPTAYEEYRGYIVFVFSVTMFVSVF